MGITITDEWKAKALRIIGQTVPKLEFGELEIVLRELGLDTYLEVREGRALVRDLTDLQTVAFAAALAAYYEAFHL